jgi:hypothetical protein
VVSRWGRLRASWLDMDAHPSTAMPESLEMEYRVLLYCLLGEDGVEASSQTSQQGLWLTKGDLREKSSKSPIADNDEHRKPKVA